MPKPTGVLSAFLDRIEFKQLTNCHISADTELPNEQGVIGFFNLVGCFIDNTYKIQCIISAVFNNLRVFSRSGRGKGCLE